MTLHWFDTLAAAVMIFFAAMGAWRGFVGEIFPALALMGGGSAAAALHERASQVLSGFVKEGLGRDIAAYALVFMVVWAAVSLIGVGVRKLSGNYQSVTTANHLAGFTLGVAKGALAMAILVIVFSLAPSLRKDLGKNSVTGPVFATVGSFALETLSPGLAKKVDDGSKQGILERAGNIKKAVETLEFKGIGKNSPSPSGATKKAQ